ncbi:radical SAM family heme chaperone HemW [Candidatus Dependentiae bacterium]|nr:radical SAM family heme chaperone HemW [Candidatus Dependentiae bacterium]
MEYCATRPTQSLYIHWPFCPYKCHFCPFVAVAGQEKYMRDYHAALVQELTAFVRTEPALTLRSLFIGGGTPSTYPPELLLDMFGILSTMVAFAPECEVSLEVNPGTVTAEKIAVWQQVGINRLSIGVQSLNDRVLRDLNRHQAAADVLALLAMAHDKFAALSIDLILGLPGIADDEWRCLLESVVQWPIKHLSLYFLTIHENTPLYAGVARGKVQLPPDESVVALYQWSVEWLAAHGFVQYEISNFARPGYESVHNSAYWQRVPYKGIGVGAHSFDGLRRFANTPQLASYLQRCQEGISPVQMREELTPMQQLLETIMLQLRQRGGLLLSQLMPIIRPEKQGALLQEVERLVDAGYVRYQDDRIVMTPAGLAVENEIVVRLMRTIE